MAVTHGPNHVSRRLFLGGAVGVGATMTVAPAYADGQDGQTEDTEQQPAIRDHGTVPLTATTVLAAAAGNTPDGHPRLWAVVNGSPAYLAEIDPIAGTLENTYPMLGASGAWGVTISDDGTVWAASHMDGSLYYLEPGATDVLYDGRPTPDTSFMWQVDTDADGIAYSGTFQGWADSPLPPGHLVSYDRTTKQWRDYGTFGPELTYVRSTAVVGDTVYAGTGTTAALFAVDIASGSVEQIPMPDGHDDCTFVYGLASAEHDLFATFECDGDYIGYVYDTVGRQWSETLGNLSSESVGRTADGTTYFTLAGELVYLDTSGEVVNTTNPFGGRGLGVSTDHAGEEWIVSITSDGLVHRYSIATGSAETGSSHPRV